MKKKLKYIVVFILAFLIISGGLVYFFRKQLISKFIPTVEQIGIININVKNDTSYIHTKIAVKNKFFLKIGIDSIKYKVELFGNAYIENEEYLGMVLPRYGNDTIDFYLKIPYANIIRDLRLERKKGDSASYSINVSLQYSTIFGNAVTPISKSSKLKIPQPPELAIVEIKYKRIRLKSIEAIAKIKVVNYSPVTLEIKNMRYSMKISKGGNLKGSYNSSIVIKPKGTSYVYLPIEIKINNLGKILFNILMNKDKYTYQLTVEAVLESTDPIKKSFHIDLVKNGVMELKK